MSIHRVFSLPRISLQSNGGSLFFCRQFQHNNTSGFIAMRYKHMALKKGKEKLRTYVVQQYVDYVKNYTKFFEEKFPNAVNMYRVFSIGIKDFLKDLKTYITLRIKIIKDQGFSNLSRQEIELYHKMPSDMYKIAPVLILSAIPFGNYVIFPLAFWKPKSLLCSHFWSIQQKAEFSRQDLRDRLKNNKPVFRALQSKLDLIQDEDLKMKFTRVVALLGSGVHPTPAEVLDCRELFSSGPYRLQSLTYSHMGYLLRMHGLRRSLFRAKRLQYLARLVLEMDRAIEREGGVERLGAAELRRACALRGLHAAPLPAGELRGWLTGWLAVSRQLDARAASLLLHCPVLLAYNHPQNWMLVY